MHNLKILFVNANNMSLESLVTSSFLTATDIEQLSKFKLEETKKEKACSFILKNKYVGDYHLNEFGKPISDNTYFNISHSKGVVVFVKDDYPIGIDVEQIRPLKEEMVDYISSQEEKAYIHDDVSFFEIWTNKESLTKCLGTGIKSRIKEIPALPINGKKGYNNKNFYSKTVVFQNCVISIVRNSEEPFEEEIIDVENDL